MASLTGCGASVSANFTGITRANTSSCSKAGGMRSIYAAAEGDIDLAATAAAANFDTATRVLSNVVMNGTGVFYEIQTDGETTEFTWEKQDNGNYLCTLTAYFQGTSCARVKAIIELARVCPMVVFVQLADCTQFLSLEEGGAAGLTSPSTPVEISGDSLTSGTAEGDGSSQTLTISWTQSAPPLCGQLDSIPT